MATVTTASTGLDIRDDFLQEMLSQQREMIKGFMEVLSTKTSSSADIKPTLPYFKGCANLSQVVALIRSFVVHLRNSRLLSWLLGGPWSPQMPTLPTVPASNSSS